MTEKYHTCRSIQQPQQRQWEGSRKEYSSPTTACSPLTLTLEIIKEQQIQKNKETSCSILTETLTRPNWARKVRELILFNVLCTLYCGRGCLSLESEGKEMRGCVSLESGIFVADNGTTGQRTTGHQRCSKRSSRT